MSKGKRDHQTPKPTQPPTGGAGPHPTVAPDHSQPLIPGNEQTLPLASPPSRLEPGIATPPATTDASPSSEAIGDVSNEPLPRAFGDFQLLEVLGRGGMGVVYLARQASLERPVALKMIRDGSLASPQELARFQTEARSAARLQHPNIVKIYQLGHHGGHSYFSMDYIPGSDLAKKIAMGPMDPYQAAQYARQIADAISHAHEQGVVHRDLKPANVLVNQQDQVAVTDFGLAKTLGTESGITETGATLGTPSYMSPEQAGGKTQEHAQPTDIYAIGAILFAMLAGRPPFSAPSPMQTLMQVLHQAPPRLRTIAPWTPVDLQTIVEKCLAKQPSKRYPSARALADELDRFLQHQPIEAKPPTVWQRAIQWMLRIPIIAALSGHRSSDPSPAHRWAQRGLIAIFALIPFLWFFGTSWYRNHKQQVLPESIVIAGGAPGGIYQEVAQQLAERLMQHVPSQVVALPTEGSADNLQRLVSGNVQLALLQSSSIQSGEVLVVTPLYQEALHLLVRSDLSWQGFPSLKGRRLAVGPTNSGSRQAAQWVLDFHGIDPSQLELLPWDPGQLPGEPPADAALLMIKPGASTIARLLGNQSYRLLSIPDALEITEEQPALRVVEIQRFDYPNNSQFDAITTVGATAYLTCSSRAPNRLVQETLEAIYGGISRLPGTLPLEKAQQFRGLPLHPAARAFFDAAPQPENSGNPQGSKALSK